MNTTTVSAPLPRALLALALGNFAIGVNALVIAGILPALEAAFGVSPAQVGLLITLYALGYALASPLLVMLSGAWPRRTLIMSGLILLALGSLLGALAPNYGVLLGSRLIAARGPRCSRPPRPLWQWP
ncbi:MFS transporter [Deinococcus frigens]|uniref:MFS transporter n=1 Tax=Deinococcus frigens TaxID=249403 RepID=UPI00068F3202